VREKTNKQASQQAKHAKLKSACVKNFLNQTRRIMQFIYAQL